MCLPFPLYAVRRSSSGGCGWMWNGDVIARSLPRLPLYGTLRTEKIDVSDMSVQEAAGAVARLAGLG